jgi:subtilisin family serine protease
MSAPAPSRHLVDINYPGYLQQRNTFPKAGGVGVAIIDSGVSMTRSPWLSSQIHEVWDIPIAGETRQLYPVPDGDSPAGSYDDDPHQHGTLMARMIGESGLGVATNAELYCYRLPVVQEERDGVVYHVVRQLETLRALEHLKGREQIRIINMSLASAVPRGARAGCRASMPLKPEFRRVIRDLVKEGKVVVIASGNGAPAVQSTGLPGRLPGGLTVGSARESGQNWVASAFSLSYARFRPLDKPAGKLLYYKPDSFAPGEVLFPGSPRRMRGTSFAAALTSGVVAEALSRINGAALGRREVLRIAELLRMSGRPCRSTDCPAHHSVALIDMLQFITAVCAQFP